MGKSVRKIQKFGKKVAKDPLTAVNPLLGQAKQLLGLAKDKAKPGNLDVDPIATQETEVGANLDQNQGPAPEQDSQAKVLQNLRRRQRRRRAGVVENPSGLVGGVGQARGLIGL
jgi:hypothetical protein